MIRSISEEKLSWAKIDPVLPIRSNTRRISGAKITGIASSSIGSVLVINQENAGSTRRLESKLMTTIKNKTPRSKTSALVSLSM
jgi:hypothetical protein